MKAPDEIKKQLKNWLITHHGHKSGDVFIEELCIFEKNNRADLVHANGALLGFEIKSGSDTLVRWEAQMNAYSKVFDEVWLCCHAKHAPKALQQSTISTGLIIFDDFDGLAMLRPAKKNKLVDSYQLTCLLWRIEIDELCKSNGLSVSKKEKIHEARKRCSEQIDIEVIKAEVLTRLKTRYAVLDQSISSSSSSSSSGGGIGLKPPISI